MFSTCNTRSLLLAVTTSVILLLGGCATPGSELSAFIEQYKRHAAPKALAIGYYPNGLWVAGAGWGQPDLGAARSTAIRQCEEQGLKRGAPIACRIAYENAEFLGQASGPTVAASSECKADSDCPWGASCRSKAGGGTECRVSMPDTSLPTPPAGIDPTARPAPQAPSAQPPPRSATGSGVFVTPDGHVLTAEHVVRGATDIQIVTQDGRRVRARVQSSSRSLDLAVLTTDSRPSAFLPVRLARPTSGMRVFTVGYPLPGVLGQEPKFSDGVINAASGIRDDASFMQISIPIQPGNSGGPVVTEDGLLVGIVTSSAAVAPFIERTGTIPQNVNWAVHSSLATTLLGIEGPRPQIRTRAQAIADTIKASVLILVDSN